MITKQAKQPGNAKDNPSKLARLSLIVSKELESIDEILETLHNHMVQLNEKIDLQLKTKQKEDDATDDDVKVFKKIKELQDKNNEMMKQYQGNLQEVRDAFNEFDRYYQQHYLPTIQKNSSL